MNIVIEGEIKIHVNLDSDEIFQHIISKGKYSKENLMEELNNAFINTLEKKKSEVIDEEIQVVDKLVQEAKFMDKDIGPVELDNQIYGRLCDAIKSCLSLNEPTDDNVKLFMEKHTEAYKILKSGKDFTYKNKIIKKVV